MEITKPLIAVSVLSLTPSKRSVCHAPMDAWNAETATHAQDALPTSTWTSLHNFVLKNAVMEKGMSSNVTMEITLMATDARDHAKSKMATPAEEDLPHHLITASFTTPQKSHST